MPLMVAAAQGKVNVGGCQVVVKSRRGIGSRTGATRFTKTLADSAYH
jgi:hypothetical protein